MATIREVAKKAGVSIAAVSRILNFDDTLSVSDETRKKVFVAADELKYVKKSRKGENIDDKLKNAERRPLVALVNERNVDKELEDIYYMSIRLAVEEKLAESGFRIQHLTPEQLGIDDSLISAYIGLGDIPEADLKRVTDASRVVLIDNYPHKRNLDYVGVDLAMAVEEVMEYLYSQGHRKIALLADRTPEDTKSEGHGKLDGRIRGYINFMIERGIYDDEMFIKVPYFSSASAYAKLKERLAKPNVPTAVIACNDSMAIGAYKAIVEAGYRVGRDISVVGFNDQSNAEFMMPSLTTVRLPMQTMGEVAVEMIKELIRGREYNKVTLLKTELIVRESSGPVRNN